MRRLTTVMFIMFCLSGNLVAQTEPLTVSFSPPGISVNVLNASVFDPANAAGQPVYTNLAISNVSAASVDFDLGLAVTWNNLPQQLLSLSFPALLPIQPGEQWNLSNRDLITDQQSPRFGEPVGEIDIDQIMNVDPVLKSALEAGVFPDGKLTFIATVTPRNRMLRSMTATFTVSISNIKSIFPAYPGTLPGQLPPKINLKPVTFLWNSLITSFNNFRLTIKEFVPGAPPSANMVESGGRIVYDGEAGKNIFSEYLPFQTLHYYAWRVQTTLVNESNYADVSRSRNFLSSQWFIFQYDDSHSGNDTSNQEFTALLNMLNDPAILALLSAGFMPTGVVIQDGQVFTGQPALDLINSLLGKPISVEITEQ